MVQLIFGITIDNEYIICDWKITSSNEETDIKRYIWQLKLYYLLEKDFCIDSKKILMIIINPKLKIVIKEKVNITKQDLEKIKDAILIWQEREEWENATKTKKLIASIGEIQSNINILLVKMQGMILINIIILLKVIYIKL
ncbi:hypothetical protein [Spiroplasma poulsonii]|uniref:Uncharacterized protein n=1 Tax=Spiroplasma poulsonii TaxID=2138 RepID=A0A2P6F8F9_9MOLU|nr:hypothetical protein [Spiroplasma poulsonii]PQM29741.1 hypothetical protein SMSRO_SF029090 [Spiroplasma poulsonii]